MGKGADMRNNELDESAGCGEARHKVYSSFPNSSYNLFPTCKLSTLHLCFHTQPSPHSLFAYLPLPLCPTSHIDP